MNLQAAVYLGAMLVSLLTTPIVIRLARKYGVVDKPNARKVHRKPVPRIGGVAIALGLFVPSAIAFIAHPENRLGFASGMNSLIAFGAVAGAVFLVGFADDLWNLPSRIKLVILLGGAATLCKCGVLIQTVAIGSTYFNLGLFAWPVTMLWIVGVTVSINFIDGLDGLAAGIAAMTCGVLAVIAAIHGDLASSILSLALLGSLTGFLFFNFNPARIFMGDCGSMLLGVALGALSAGSVARSMRMADLALPALAMGVPLMDSALTMIRRSLLQRRSIFAAERGHIHHCLMDRGFEHRQAVLVIYAVTFICAALGLLTLKLDSSAAKIAGVAGLGVILILFRGAGSVRLRDTVEAFVRHRRRKLDEGQDRHAFEETQLRLQHASVLENWWQELTFAADRLGFAHLRLPMARRDGASHVLEWTKERAADDPHDVMQTTLGLRQRRGEDKLQFEVGVLVNGSLEVAGRRLMLFQRLLDEFSLEELGRKEGLQKGALQRAAWQRGSNGHKPARNPEVEQLLDDSIDRLHLGPTSKRRVAIVHDFLYCYAGAERVLEQLLKVYPEADLFSLFDFVPAEQRKFLQGKEPRTSFIQKLPFANSKHRAYLPLMPLAIEQLDVSDYDIVISSSYVAAKGVLTRADQLHVCYCHTPVRFAWDMQKQYLGGSGLIGSLKSFAARLLLHYVRSWDVRSANGVDVFTTNSNYVGLRIEKIYRRRSTTIYPPVCVDQFECSEKKENFYLTVSRLVPYKKIDLLAEAFAHCGDRKLVIIGDGPEMAAIKAVAGPNVEILGYQSAEVVQDYMKRARAFLFAAEEDFGIAPLEAQACGTPVICFGRGGATETVVDGVTGVFFHEQTIEGIIEGVLNFEAVPSWDYAQIRANAERFSAVRFRREFEELVEVEWLNFLRNRTLARESGGIRLPASDASRNMPTELTVRNTDRRPDLAAGARFQNTLAR